MSPLRRHHRAWLDENQGRSPAWLRERLSDGLEVLHADRNHSNDAPENLVLVDYLDQVRRHGVESFLRDRPVIISRMNRPYVVQNASDRRTDMQAAYYLRLDGRTWGEVSAALERSIVIADVEAYARKHGLKWPIAEESARRRDMRRALSAASLANLKRGRG